MTGKLLQRGPEVEPRGGFGWLANLMIKNMRHLREILLVEAGLVVFLGASLFSQDWGDREYGIGLAEMQVSADQPPGALSGRTFSIYMSPSVQSAKVAELRSDTLFVVNEKAVSMHERLLEYAYEEAGFPILEFNADSSWMKVSLNCWDQENRSTGWLSASSQGLNIRSWTEILSQADAFFFLKPEKMKFYSGQGGEKEVSVNCDSLYSRPDYQLYRKQIQGSWMQVEFETPSSLCRSDEEVMELFGVKPVKRLLWIRFLDNRGRPTIFYNTRGC